MKPGATGGEAKKKPCHPGRIAGSRWSGRQDLNLRPLGPEGPKADPSGVVPGYLESYPSDNTRVAGGAGSHAVAPTRDLAHVQRAQRDD